MRRNETGLNYVLKHDLKSVRKAQKRYKFQLPIYICAVHGRDKMVVWEKANFGYSDDKRKQEIVMSMPKITDQIRN